MSSPTAVSQNGGKMRRKYQIAKWLILIPTIMYGVFPVFADLGPTHVFHPDWPGHARMHVVWLITLSSILAIFALYLNWTSSIIDQNRLLISGVIGLCVTGSFWIAGLTSGLYGGLYSDPNAQPSALGFPPNLIVFALEFASLSAGLFLTIRNLSGTTRE